jgi:Fur family ferric uptake transcriptional regulator
MTAQRRVILEELRKVDTHPTADTIYDMVRRRLPHISLGTVYRNLDRMADVGLIRRLESAGSQLRFDGDTAEHYHLRCVQCGRLEDAPIEPDGSLEHQIRQRSAYDILGHHVEFHGVCPECRVNQTSGRDKVAGI